MTKRYKINVDAIHVLVSLQTAAICAFKKMDLSESNHRMNTKMKFNTG